MLKRYSHLRAVDLVDRLGRGETVALDERKRLADRLRIWA